MNTISAVVGGIGIIILMTETSITWEKSKERFFEEHLSTGLVTVLLILSLLEACIALSLSIFGCRVACFVNQVVIYLPSQDNMDSVVSPEHIYDDVIF
nr:membrane-spanning 4-domains subfamily A member 4A-like [Dasypus novemcinctus]